jgi:DNA mismatch repair ATPase MutS
MNDRRRSRLLTHTLVISEQGSRHPCLETMDQINFIANDVNLTRGTFYVQLDLGSALLT